MRTCTACGAEKPSDAFPARHPAAGGGVERRCVDCRRSQRRERYRANPGQELAKADEWARANRERINAAAAARRVEALRRYSRTPEPSCACCGEETLAFLTFEHVDGGGTQHRRRTGGGGFISWLRTNGYPPGFEVLCMNCNHGRRVNGGRCPHDDAVRLVVLKGA